MKILSINGVAVASPTRFSPTIQDIDGEETGRNQAGTMYRIVIAPEMRSFACEWTNITEEQKNAIIMNTGSRYGFPVFTLSFINEIGDTETAKFYRGGLTVEQSCVIPGEEKYNVSFNMIENDARGFVSA